MSELQSGTCPNVEAGACCHCPMHDPEVKHALIHAVVKEALVAWQVEMDAAWMPLMEESKKGVSHVRIT